MTPARPAVNRRLAEGLWAAVARVPEEALCGYLSPLETAEAGDAVRLPLPDNCGLDAGLDAISDWCAFRLVQAARVEIGAEVLVRAEADFSAALFRAVRARGGFPRSEASSYARAVLVGAACAELADVLAHCRRGGLVVLTAVSGRAADINLYPDVHRRGIELRSVKLTAVDPADWLDYRARHGGD
jgi:hypothetical protein